MSKNKAQWWVLGTVSLAVFMAMLDITIVSVALPEIQHSFAVNFTALQWVLNAYTLVYAVMLLPVSKLGDRFGRKRIFLGGLLLFLGGSLADALALNDSWLNVARGVQGMGGAAMMSLSLAIVTAAFPSHRRGLALGIWSSAVGLAVSSGPLVGGVLVASLGWRAIFWINVPIGLVTIALGAHFIPNQAHQKTTPFDWGGLVTSALVVFSLILGLLQKEAHYQDSWFDWHVWGWGVLAVVAGSLFIFCETRGDYPLIDLTLFKSKSFMGANLAAFTVGAGLYGLFTYLSILMQNYMGYSALATGVRLLLISVFTLVLGPVAGILADKVGNRGLISGALLVGMVGILLINGMLRTPFSWAALYPGFIFLGISNALLNPPISNAAMGAVAPHQIGMASGIINVFRQMGISFGIVILGLSITKGYLAGVQTGVARLAVPAALKAHLVRGLNRAGAFSGQRIFTDPRAAAYRHLPIYHQLRGVVTNAFNQGLHQASMVVAGLLGAGAVLTWLLVRNPRRSDSGTKATGDEKLH